MSYNIVSLAGDGVGPEVTEAALTVLQTVLAKKDKPVEIYKGYIGGASYVRCGLPFDPQSRVACQSADAVLLGAVGGPRWDHLPSELRPEAGLLSLRKDLDVYANIRPVVARKCLFERTPYRDEILKDVDLVIVRELTGGIYFGEKSRTSTEAFDVCTYNVTEIRRITRVAADLARTRRKKISSVDKANVMETSRLWRKTVSDLIRNDYPDLELEHILVDSAAMYLAQKPSTFDVILTENMFGDILSDQASTLAGSLGIMPSASLSDTSVGLYEPIHGSAPTLAGQGIANPIGSILSVAMMLRHSLHSPDLAELVEKAVEAVINQGFLTPDLLPKGSCRTVELTQRICDRL